MIGGRLIASACLFAAAVVEAASEAAAVREPAAVRWTEVSRASLKGRHLSTAEGDALVRRKASPPFACSCSA